MQKTWLVLALVTGCGAEDGSGQADLMSPSPGDLTQVLDVMAARSGVGDPCTGDSAGDGGLTAGTCKTDQMAQVCIPDGELGVVDGYCSLRCATDEDCPVDAACILFSPAFGLCYLRCTAPADCRQPYYDCVSLAGGKPDVCATVDPGGFGNSGGPPPGTRDGGACVTPVVKPTPGVFGPNVQLSPGGNMLAAEVGLGADPLGKNVVASWVRIGAGGAGIGAIHSGDDGRSWDRDFVLPVDRSIDKDTEGGDPMVALDGLGNVWVVWLGFDRSPFGSATNTHIWAARSTNGGLTFESRDLYQVSPQNESPVRGVDKPWIAASRTDGTAFVTWMRGMGAAGRPEIRVARFDGAAWSAPSTVNDAGKRVGSARNLAQIAMGDDGHAVVVWVEINKSPLGAIGNQVYVQALNPDGTKRGANVLVSRPPDSPSFDDPSIALWRDNVHVGYVSGNARGVWDILVATSIDGGATFAPAVKANDDPSCATHFHHQIATDARGGVHAIWYDNRYLDGNVFYAASPPADAMNPLAFGKNTFVNDQPFTFSARRDQTNWLGDYLGFVAVGNEIYAAWGDNRVANRTQVYFAKGTVQ